MPTHDYVIANGTGSSVRSDINDALAAIVSQNSSSTAPATTYAYMIWVDTTTNIVKMRNGANSAWIDLFETDGEFGSKTFNGNVTLNAQGDLRFADSDSSNWVAFQAPATVASNVTWTLPSADGTANQTLVTNGSGTLSWATPTSTSDIITEGNTSAEVVDTGSDGHFKVITEGTEALRVDASRRLLVGTSTARSNIYYTTNATTPPIQAEVATNSYSAGMSLINYSASGYNPSLTLGASSSNTLGTNTALGGSYGLGAINFVGADGTDFRVGASIVAVNDQGGAWASGDCPARLVFSTTADGASSPTERMRIDSSGRLLVGTTSAFSAGSVTQITKTGAANGSQTDTLVINNDNSNQNDSLETSIAFVRSGNSASNIYTRLSSVRTGTHDTDFRLSVNSGGTLTERMRITSDGRLLVTKTTAGLANSGFEVTSNSEVIITRNADTPLQINRLTDDGALVGFYQASTLEGTISVSGTTVSYNGAHLSRWSQLPSGIERTEILRGSVLSNIDEMCEWEDEDNEQLNRMKVSDVEGDKNVSGVFQAWDDDDDTYTNDFYCAMTGDFIIRIGAGVTVERGDLLMSAGDGTAKPQGDGFVQDKTIAKVTSTHVTCTYDDGSYCVPCVLMAC